MTNKKLILIKTIKELMALNPLRNDLDAYLYHLCEYALGESKEKPRKEDYGI